MKLQEIVQILESRQKKADLPQIFIGDTVRVGVYIQEGNKQRLQSFQGTVIAQHRAGIHTTITVRKQFQGIGVERVFTIHSPCLHSIDVLRRSRVRRAKLYYLRERMGKGTRLITKLNM